MGRLGQHLALQLRGCAAHASSARRCGALSPAHSVVLPRAIVVEHLVVEGGNGAPANRRPVIERISGFAY
jgi:hypothetical protein